MKMLKGRTAISILALFALALQIIGTSGHFHLAKSETSFGQLGHSTVWPPAGKTRCPAHDRDKDCAICWTIVANGAAVIGSGADIPRPIFEAVAILRPHPAQVRYGRVTASFQARAPPDSADV